MQILFNGVVSGLGIALIAVAFQLVYLPTRIFFLGLAGLYTVAPYIYLIAQKEFGIWQVSLCLSVIGTCILAVLMECGNHAPLSRKKASDGAHMISSLGVYIILVQLVAMMAGNNTLTLRTGLDETFEFGELIVTQSQLITSIVAAIFIFAFLSVLYLTNFGTRLRALADNPEQLALYGYNINAHRLIVFALSGIFVATGSLLIAYDIGFDPNAGLHATLLAVVALIVGGGKTFVGPIVGGLVLGILRSEVVWHLSARWQDVVTFALLVLVLLLLPGGLIGQKSRIELRTQ
ncbi:MAG: branched-chain amino acid ABC transporter permease [Nitrospira sp.]|nr:branched-chain amino acid ABC transporter permease [Nitrospira sp.]